MYIYGPLASIAMDGTERAFGPQRSAAMHVDDPRPAAMPQLVARLPQAPRDGIEGAGKHTEMEYVKICKDM
jgi:hypothetical protein